MIKSTLPLNQPYAYVNECTVIYFERTSCSRRRTRVWKTGLTVGIPLQILIWVKWSSGHWVSNRLEDQPAINGIWNFTQTFVSFDNARKLTYECTSLSYSRGQVLNFLWAASNKAAGRQSWTVDMHFGMKLTEIMIPLHFEKGQHEEKSGLKKVFSIELVLEIRLDSLNHALTLMVMTKWRRRWFGLK